MINSDSPDILKEIVRVKKDRVSDAKKSIPISSLKNMVDPKYKPLNFAGALMGNGIRLIAEIKRASPSKGLFDADIDAKDLASIYADNGAAAISVLTNEDHFRGSIDDLEVARSVTYPKGIPLLRKEFIFDPYQIYEAKAFGADAILLIVAMLDKNQIMEFMDIASSLWLQCLVEIHKESELEIAIECNADIIGINNRDLHTFKTDLIVTEQLAPLVPTGKVVVSESGISTKDDVVRMHKAGAGAILVGESLVRSGDPALSLKELT